MRSHVWIGLLIAAQATSGCATLVGGGLGAVIDSGSQKSISPSTLDDLAMGAPIVVRLRSGATPEGRYEGQRRSSADEYAARYAAAHERTLLALGLPRLGERLAVHRDGRILSARFIGFDPYGLVVESDDGAESVIALRVVDDVTTAAGINLGGDRLLRLAVEGRLPFRSRLALGPQLVALEDIRSITLKEERSRDATLVGAALGFLLDVAALVVISSIDFQ